MALRAEVSKVYEFRPQEVITGITVVSRRIFVTTQNAVYQLICKWIDEEDTNISDE